MTHRKRLWILCILSVLLLIAIDQGSKLFIAHVYEVGADYPEAANQFHIHPLIHGRTMQTVQNLAKRTSLPAGLLLTGYVVWILLFSAALLLFLYGLHRFYFWDCDPPKRLSRLFPVFGCFCTAAGICSAFFDDVFWGGSLDFLCFTREGQVPFGNHFHPAVNHAVFDLKDIYVFMTVLLGITYSIWFLIVFIKEYRKDQAKYDNRVKHPIQNIRRMREQKKKEKQI